MTLLPFDRPASLTVSWTLVYEIIFYLIFLSFYAVRRFGLLMAFWGTAVIALNALDVASSLPAPFDQILSPLMLEFLAGMAIAYVFVKHRVPDWRFLLPLGLALVALYWTLTGITVVIFGLGIAMLVLLVAELERKNAIRVPRAAATMGAGITYHFAFERPALALASRRSVKST